MNFTIGGLYDGEWTDRSLALYCNQKDYDNLTKGFGYSNVQIRVSNEVDYEEFVHIIADKFKDSNKYKYYITDERLNQEITERGSIGIYILVESIIVVLFSFMVIILFVFLSEHIRGQGENIRLLYVLGASKDDVYSMYMLQSIVVGLFTLVLSFGAGVGLTKLFFANTGYYLPANFMTIITYLLISVIVMLSFLLPVHLELRSRLKKL